MSGRFIAIVGPSGVGKDSVMTAMAKAEPRLTLTRRVITRPSDAGGEEFDGVSLRAFETLEDAGSFALSWAAHGLKYGIPTVVDQSLMDGRDVLANLSRGALLKAKSRFASFTIIHLTARHDVLAQRLSQRGREDTAEISRRLERASFGLPAEIEAIQLDNSGPLDDTVRAALDLLYPEDVTL